MEEAPETTQPPKPTKRKRKLASRRRFKSQEELDAEEELDRSESPEQPVPSSDQSNDLCSTFQASCSLNLATRPLPTPPTRRHHPPLPALPPNPETNPPPLPPRAPTAPTVTKSRFPYFEKKKTNAQQQLKQKQVAQKAENRRSSGKSSIFSSNGITSPSRATFKAAIDRLRARSSEVLDSRASEAPEARSSRPSTSRGASSDERRTRQALTLPPTPTYPMQLPVSMSHVIKHVFVRSTFIMPGISCDYCLRQIMFGVKCRECKYKCHNQCSLKVPPSCGLPSSIFDEVMKRMSTPDTLQLGYVTVASTSSSSSVGSSSENVMNEPRGATGGPPETAEGIDIEDDESREAIFMELDLPMRRTTRTLVHPNQEEPDEPARVTPDLDDSEATMVPSSADSERTLTSKKSISSRSSQGSDKSLWCRKIGSSLGEWDIPYHELEIGEQLGVGRLGPVFKGQWHGYVAVKFIKPGPCSTINNDFDLVEDFKRDVRLFCLTRHENLVLFMGACMKPPHLALVMSLCNGNTLFTHIHKLRDRFPVSRAVLIAQQITQGMGYLHSRGIVHKDLKTKNVFLEKGKVVITDFGLFSMEKLVDPRFVKHGIKDDILAIPKRWLCYLAPELIRSIRSKSHDVNDPSIMPFTRASDVFAFGTIWFELICGKFPYDRQQPEVVIWQVGRGLKHPLVNVEEVSHDVRSVLFNCWGFYAVQRPTFTDLLKLFEQWPKERPKRSPSHPINLTRAWQSVCH